MNLEINVENVIKANTQFWEQMLTMTLETAPISEAICMESGHLLGAVVLDGVWKGRIEIRIATNLAYEATAAMMMQARETVESSDVLDAAKEIANMVAGTIKSSLPRPCTMSVPESRMEDTGICFAPRTENTLSVAFRHTSGDLMVRIREQQGGADSPSDVVENPSMKIEAPATAQ